MSIALTFDDGPDPRWTPRVLDELARLDIRATFFPLSPRAIAYPSLVARILDEGHLVGLHGHAHLKHPRHTREAVRLDTERALGVLPDVRFWRFPYGMDAPFSHGLAREFGLQVVGWTHDTHDWRGDTAASMLALAAPAVREPEAVVLCHDAVGPGGRRDGCAETVALIEPLLAAAGRPAVRIDALGVVPSDRPA